MIKRTKYLSQLERETGRKYYYRYAGWNGIGFSFLGNTTVYLLAILYGASNTQLGYISSVMYITGITLLFYTKLFNGKSIKTVGFYAWILRGLVCLGYMALPLLQGKASVFLIMIIYTMFCITRTIGVAVQQNIQKMISTSRTRGEVVMTASTRNNTAGIFSRIFSYGVTITSYASELTELLFLQFLGVISNTISAIVFKKIPIREKIEHTPGRHVGKLLIENMKLNRERRILIVRWCSVGIEILSAMTIPFLRKYAGFSASMIFLYTIVITLAAITGALIIRPFADRLGSRPFILPVVVMIAGVFIAWMFADPNKNMEYFYILGFLTIMLQNILILLVSRLFIQVIPEKDSISFTSMDVFVTSILAFFLGFLGGYLADFSGNLQIPYLNIYGLTFSIAVLLCTIIMITAIRFEEKGSASLKKTWTMIFSIDHLKTFRDINRLNTYNTTLKRKSLILSLGYTGSSLANDEIRQIFLQPLSPERSEIIKTLFEKKRPPLIPELIKEASEPCSFNRQEAIFALGSYPTEDVEKLLITLIHDEDDGTASNAAKSLARIGNKSQYQTAYKHFLDGNRGSLRRDLNYLISFHHFDPEGKWLECLFSEDTIKHGEIYTQSFITLIARQRNMNPPLGWIFQKNNDIRGEGMSILLDEAREMELFYSNQEWLYNNFIEENYALLWEWCQSVLKEEKPAGAAVPILKSIQDFNRESADPTNTLAAVFFSYHILNTEEILD